MLSASYSKQNERFFGRRYIDSLEGKYFVNISRGELVDEAYLVKKLEDNTIKGVALDVIEDEQTGTNLSRLIALTKTRNLILTPHIGGATYHSMQKTEEFITSKLLDRIGIN